MAMSRLQALCLELITLYYVAGWAWGALPTYAYTDTKILTGYQFNPKDVYSSMTDDFEAIHIGTIDLPPCVKSLFNCWEMLNPNVVCKFNSTSGSGYWDYDQVNFDTICMDLRFQCREYTGNKPFPSSRHIDLIFDICDHAKSLNKNTWIKYL